MPWVVMNDFFLFRNRPPLDLREATALENKLRGRALVNPSINGQHDVKYRDADDGRRPVIGTTDRQTQVSSAQPEAGRFLLPFDVHYKRNVCVIGYDVKQNLFSGPIRCRRRC
jgi:putative ABC transport system permease protein